jgi:hypothetical protein
MFKLNEDIKLADVLHLIFTIKNISFELKRTINIAKQPNLSISLPSPPKTFSQEYSILADTSNISSGFALITCYSRFVYNNNGDNDKFIVSKVLKESLELKQFNMLVERRLKLIYDDIFSEYSSFKFAISCTLCDTIIRQCDTSSTPHYIINKDLPKEVPENIPLIPKTVKYIVESIKDLIHSSDDGNKNDEDLKIAQNSLENKINDTPIQDITIAQDNQTKSDDVSSEFKEDVNKANTTIINDANLNKTIVSNSTYFIISKNDTINLNFDFNEAIPEIPVPIPDKTPDMKIVKEDKKKANIVPIAEWSDNKKVDGTNYKPSISQQFKDDIDTNFNPKPLNVKLNKLNNETEKLLQTNNITEKLYKSIIISNLLNNTNCSPGNTYCNQQLETLQDKLINEISYIFDCKFLLDSVLTTERPDDHLMLSTSSLYFTTSTKIPIKNETVNKIFETVDCFIKESHKLIPAIDSHDQLFKDKYLTSMASVTSNMLNIAFASNNNQNITTPINDTSAIIFATNASINLKNMIEEQSLLLMKHTSRMIVETDNLLFYNSKLNNGEAPNTEDYFDIQTKAGVEYRVYMPTEHLMEVVNNTMTSYSSIIYNKYPMANINNNYTKDISQNVISIKLFNDKFNNIEISNLTQPFKIFMVKENPKLTHCVYFDNEIMNWNSKGCNSTDFGTYVLCKCNHLTDFSLAQYDPQAIVKDIINVFKDIRIINDFGLFGEELTFENAIIIYIFSGILVVYLIGLFFTLRYDLKYSFFTIECDKIEGCCSKEETINQILEIKQIADDGIYFTRKEIIKNFFMAASDNKNANESIRKILNIKIDGDNSEPEVDKKENVLDILKKRRSLGDKPAVTPVKEEEEFKIGSQDPPRRVNVFRSIFKKRKKGEQKDIEMSASTNDKTKINENQFSEKLRKITVKNNMIKVDDDIEIHYQEFIKRLAKTKNDKLKQNLIRSFNLNESIFAIEDKEKTTSNPEQIQTSLDEIPLKYEWYYKFISIGKYMFITEHKLINIFMPMDSVYTKTNILTLIIFRLVVGLTIVALLEPADSKSGSEELSSQVI